MLRHRTEQSTQSCKWPDNRRAPVTRRRLALLRNRQMLRLAAECIGLSLVGIVIFQVVVEPDLLARFPALFPEPSVSQTGRRLPRTRVGWAEMLYLSVICGPYLYYRLYRTQLGAEVQETVMAELREDR